MCHTVPNKRQYVVGMPKVHCRQASWYQADARRPLILEHSIILCASQYIVRGLFLSYIYHHAITSALSNNLVIFDVAAEFAIATVVKFGSFAYPG